MHIYQVGFYELYVATDESDARLAYRERYGDTEQAAIDAGLSQVRKVKDSAELWIDDRGKTAAEWATENGRGFFAAIPMRSEAEDRVAT